MRWGFIRCCHTAHCDQSHVPTERSAQIVKLHRLCVCVCVCYMVPNTNPLSLGSFLLAAFKFSRLWAAFALWKYVLLTVSWCCTHLCRRLNYNPLMPLKSERSSGMLRRDNCQASLQTPSAPSTPQRVKGEREEGGLICGTTLWAEPSATALLLPDHNQMCQVCPNRNDCLKAIFSNLSGFRAPSPPSAPWLLKDKYKH